MISANCAESADDPVLFDRLEKAGLFRASKYLGELYQQARVMAENAGTANSPAFEAFASYIPSKSVNPDSQPVLVVDVGGASTKVGIRRILAQKIEWQLLFEADNDDLRDPAIKSSGLESFTSSLGKLITSNASRLKIGAGDISACAIVWSNAFESQPADQAGSITGIVVQKEMYKKGEWFNRDLKNGTDLGKVFTRAFEYSGLRISRILVGNDTPLTMKAASGAQGGMVASTGLNGTLVKNLRSLGLAAVDQSVICNAEMGGRFFIPSNLRSDFDLTGTGAAQVTIEALVAGGFLPRIFVDHVIGLARIGQSELKPLADYLSSLPDRGYNFFKSEDLESLISTPGRQTFIQGAAEIFSTEVLATLSTLSTQIFIRAARLAAVVAFGTVSNQIAAHTDLLVALDSSLCRASRVFNENFLSQLAVAPTDADGCTLSVALLEPLETENGKISVPMQGAASALDCMQ